MKNILIYIFVAIIIPFCLDSCGYDSQSKRIKELEDSISYFKNKYLEKDSIYDSIYTDYISLREKMTKHIQYVYTVYDEVIKDENGYEWDLSEFFHEKSDEYGYVHVDNISDYVLDHYDKWDIIEMFNLGADDFDDNYEPDYDERWSPR